MAVETVLLVFAFTAGIAAFLSPCAFALLPSYITLHLGLKEKEQSKGLNVKTLAKGLYFGSITSLGFITLFSLFGILIGLFGQVIKPLTPYIIGATGVIISVLGLLLLLNIDLSKQIPTPKLFRSAKGGTTGFYFYGVGYGLAALGCTLPVFLAVVIGGLSAGGLLGAVALFASYSLGMTLLMIGFTIAIIAAKDTVMRYTNVIMPYMKRISGALLLIAGIILVYRQVFGISLIPAIPLPF